MNTIDEIRDIFKNYIENENFSGVGLIKKGDEALFHEAYGYAHRGWKVPNKLDTKFDTASITKVFTSVAILQLIDKKLLTLEDKVLDIINIGDSKINDEVTVYQLLTHTSGIADDADEEAGESYEEIWKSKPNYSVRETVDYLPQFINKEPNFQPGKGCRYNNCAFILLGLIIEKITGKSYRQYIQENIFDAIGMDNTGFYAMDQVVENAAEHYASILDDEENITGYRKNIYSYPSIGSADAGALTTAQDLDLFIRALKDEKLLSRDLTKAILQPRETYRKYKEVTEVMGLGVQFLLKNDTEEVIYIQKDGVNAGVSCIMNYIPEHDLTIILLANQDTNVWDLAWEIQNTFKIY